MTPEAAVALCVDLFRTVVLVVGPVLGASLIAGVIVGIVQTATQLNEASVSYVVKVLAVAGVLAVGGGAISAQAITYTRNQLQAIGTVVR